MPAYSTPTCSPKTSAPNSPSLQAVRPFLLFIHRKKTPKNTNNNNHPPGFKRIHCISFGAPPISLLPLTKPLPLRRGRSKSLFLAFINEGDPVPRADKAYVRSLLDLYLSPLPPSRIWPVPPGTLSNAGSLVLLRASGRAEDPNADEDNVNAMLTTDAQLREVVFGFVLLSLSFSLPKFIFLEKSHKLPKTPH